MWEIGRFKLFLHRGINTVHEFLYMHNAVLVYVAQHSLRTHYVHGHNLAAICEGLISNILLCVFCKDQFDEISV